MAPRNHQKLKKKTGFVDKVHNLLSTYTHILVVCADHVGSGQLQEVRISLRGKAIVCMGKNTMIKYALKNYSEQFEQETQQIASVTVGNVGLVFCGESDIEQVAEVLLSNKVPAEAKVGVISPVSIVVPAGPTGLDPSQTSFFQALNIPTKIVKSQIEICSPFQVLYEGEKVTHSQQALLKKLNMKPFTYGLQLKYIADHGSVYSAEALKISDDVIIESLTNGIRMVAAFSQESGYPTIASVPHAIAHAFKNIAAMCTDIDFTFSAIASIKEYIKDPSKFCSAPSQPLDVVSSSPVAQAPAVVEEEEEESEGEQDFDLFD